MTADPCDNVLARFSCWRTTQTPLPRDLLAANCVANGCLHLTATLHSLADHWKPADLLERIPGLWDLVCLSDPIFAAVAPALRRGNERPFHIPYVGGRVVAACAHEACVKLAMQCCISCYRAADLLHCSRVVTGEESRFDPEVLVAESAELAPGLEGVRAFLREESGVDCQEASAWLTLEVEAAAASPAREPGSERPWAKARNLTAEHHRMLECLWRGNQPREAVPIEDVVAAVYNIDPWNVQAVKNKVRALRTMRGRANDALTEVDPPLYIDASHTHFWLNRTD
jgi:hypothetical protein